MQVEQHSKIEQALHDMYKDDRVDGEWFVLNNIKVNEIKGFVESYGKKEEK